MDNNSIWRTRVQNFAGVLQRNKYVNTVSNGLAAGLSVILVGAIFTLINTINIPAYQNFLETTNLKALTSIPPMITIDILSLYVVFGVGYTMATQFKQDGFSAGLIALMSFLAVTPVGLLDDGATRALSFQWLGSTGLFVAMLIGIGVGRLYVLILEKGFYVRMPKGVPPTITKSFAAMTPAFIIIFLVLAIRGIFNATSYGNIHEFIYTVLQVPLLALGGSWWAYLIITVVISLLWFFGIHGAMVAIGVMAPIWTALNLENLSAFQAGEPLPHLFPGSSFFMTYTALGGSGATIGLVIAMVRARSKRYKTLGKLAIVPSAANINEPVIFGTPMVLNPKLFIPFMLAPIVVTGIAMIATAIGLVPPLIGIGAPLGTPILINGFLEGGWRVAALQAVLVVISFIMYFPFFRSLDKDAWKNEQELEEEERKAVE
ncbi:PTS sugar transporter subunit IIC [Bacillus sp. B1-b2]|uniref:PTS sugar transporter subunit IIC n=1 Tax=Bacillus sp. B1-b2 TaxID=2653201 RepID=UPI0012629565|nr:PTS transporter subunit EIIC [Bacillus sp. B1-b2]KAB7665052.1 PTS sugar transporter subunit IIC [Bacillus sp. B1-b2]